MHFSATIKNTKGQGIPGAKVEVVSRSPLSVQDCQAAFSHACCMLSGKPMETAYTMCNTPFENTRMTGLVSSPMQTAPSLI